MANGGRQYPEMRTACIKLTSAVSTATAAPSIPDTAMQQAYLKALAALKTGAADCLA
jgi:hypothetical protein